MKILVDADACPVKNIVIKIARKLELRVLMFIDTSHFLNDGYSEVTMVDKGRDSVDIALINKTENNDIVITQDYGVAAMALAKGAYCINQNGLIYNSGNIDKLLFERHLSQKVRRSGGKTSNPKKRTKEDDEQFEKAFMQMCSGTEIAGNDS
ncbi:MAG: YaiI/YqxD family protein [Clostridia bacterium]